MQERRPALIIRRFRPGDLRRVLRIEKEAFGRRAWPADLFRSYAAACPKDFLVAQVGSAVAAYSITRTGHGRAELDSIAVARRFRNRGIGRRLLQSVIRKLQRRKFTSLSLMVRSDNHSAIRFYRTLGFRRIRTVPKYYEGGETAWRMQLRLG